MSLYLWGWPIFRACNRHDLAADHHFLFVPISPSPSSSLEPFLWIWICLFRLISVQLQFKFISAFSTFSLKTGMISKVGENFPENNLSLPRDISVKFCSAISFIDFWIVFAITGSAQTHLLCSFFATSASQVPQPLLLVVGWVYNTQKNSQLFLCVLPQGSFGQALGKGDKNWIGRCLSWRFCFGCTPIHSQVSWGTWLHRP